MSTPTAATPKRNLNLKWLTTGNGFSQLGDGLYQFTLPIVAVSMTRDPNLIAGLNVMLSLPWLIFALLAGRIVDHSDRRRLMIAVNIARAIVLLGLTLGLYFHFVSILLLYAVAVLLGIGETLVDTALTSIIPSLTSSHERSVANARIEAGINIFNQFVAPPLAGILTAISIMLSCGISTILYAFSTISLKKIRGQFKPPVSSVRPFWTEFLVGLHFLWRQPLLRILTLLTAAMNLCWSFWSAVLVLFVIKPGTLGLGTFEYSLLLTAMALGGTLGANICTTLERYFGRRPVLMLDLLGTVILVVAPAITTNPFLIGTSMFVGGLGSSLWRIVVATIRQQLVPDELLGRVYTANRFITWGISPIGAFLAGGIGSRFGVQLVFAIGGILGGMVLLWFILVSKNLNFEA